jgi:hypothetical protein
MRYPNSAQAFVLPPLPPSPYTCPTCARPYWSRSLICRGLRVLSGLTHPPIRVRPRLVEPLKEVS